MMNRFLSCFASVGAIGVASTGAAQTATLISPDRAVTTGDIDEFVVSADGSMIAFVGQLEGDTADQAYLMSITGGTTTLLNPVDAGDVDGYINFTPDGTGVVTRWGGGDNNNDNQMYRLPIDGSQVATQLTFNNSNVFGQRVSADGQTLFYTDSMFDTGSAVDSDDLLWATPMSGDGSAPRLITADEIAEIDTGGYDLVGNDVIFAGSLPGEGESRFFRISADTTNPFEAVEIAVSNAPTDFTYDIDEMVVTPDAQSIIFVGDLTTDSVDELYSMPIAGGEATRLLPDIQEFTDIGPFVISPDGESIAFVADFEENSVGEAYVVPIEGGTPIRVSEDLTDADYNADVVAGVGRISFTPDGSEILYLADGRANGVNELFITDNPLAMSGLLADFNADGIVDLLDLDILGANWQQNGTASTGDANGDGTVDLLDLDILGSEWQSTASFAAALSGLAIPEPASAALLLAGGSLLVTRRRR